MASRDIKDLHQTLQPMVTQLLSLGQKALDSSSFKGWKFFITDGFRSNAEQTKLYAQGRTAPGGIVTNAKAGQSAHNFGLAVDCAFQKSGQLSYDPKMYSLIYPIARKLGFELGADWKGFVDKPHFEHPQWEKLSRGETIPKPTPQKEAMATKYTEEEMTVVRHARDDNWNKYQDQLKENKDLKKELSQVSKRVAQFDEVVAKLEITKADGEVTADTVVRSITAKLSSKDTRITELTKELETAQKPQGILVGRRKMLVAIVTPVVVIISKLLMDRLGVELTPDEILYLLLAGMAYIGVEGSKDFMVAVRSADNTSENTDK